MAAVAKATEESGGGGSKPGIQTGASSSSGGGGCSITGGYVGTPVATVWSSGSGDGDSMGQWASESEGDWRL